MTLLNNAKGVSIIAAIFIIVVLAFMGVMFLSMISTSTLTSVNDLQSTQAFSLAEGGIEYGKGALASYSSWYNFANDPYSLATNQDLGNGTFTTTINVPATTARKSFGIGATVIRVFSVDLFPASGGRIAVGGSGDIRTYTNTAMGGALGNRFEGVSTPGPSGYAAGTSIYPVLTLAAGITPLDTTIPFAENSSKFLQKGTITIVDPVNGDEEITCAGIQTNPATAFIGCYRDAMTANAHAAGLNILPILTRQEVLIQAEGVVGSARRVITDVTGQ